MKMSRAHDDILIVGALLVSFSVSFFLLTQSNSTYRDITAYRAKKEEHLVVNPRKLINCPLAASLASY